MSVSDKDREQMRRDWGLDRQRVIRAYRLTRDDVARTGTLDPNDPLSLYTGNFALQAAMIAEERSASQEDTETQPLPMPVSRPVIEPHIELGYN